LIIKTVTHVRRNVINISTAETTDVRCLVILELAMNVLFLRRLCSVVRAGKEMLWNYLGVKTERVAWTVFQHVPTIAKRN
jgi:hypothetical protein